MKYDFTTILERKGMDSIAAEPTAWYGIDVPTKEGFRRIPMWVADMSFPTFPGVTDALKKRLEHPCFGYFAPTDEYTDAIIRWQKVRNHAEVKPEHIGYENGVLGGVITALNVLCSRGDAVLLHSPTYIGFTNSVGANGYRMILSDLKRDQEGIWRMDLADMEEKIRENHIHAAVFCSPHNPCGRVWEADELKQMMDLFERYEVYVICDEIWSDLILEGYHHIPLHSVSSYAHTHVITQYAPSKTFSLAGIPGSYHICFNSWLNDRLAKEAANTHYNAMSVLWMHAMTGGFTEEGAVWVDELCSVLSGNIRYASSFIREHIPGVEFMEPQGTYMMYLDCETWCRQNGVSMDELLRKGVEYGVLWQDGRPFHRPYAIRMNLAVPFELVKEAFDRLDRYVFHNGAY